MAGDEGRTALRYIDTLFEVGSLGGLSDGQFLRRFTKHRGGASEFAFALALLVERHGSMVLRVCRSILADSHAAEEAFQATIRVLTQKAGSLQARESIAPWIYQVALRVASCARSNAFRRRKHEARAAEQEVISTQEESPGDVRPIEHAEVDALPER
jgi:DNA-directed RNA polymerase specialized sigma24 family protein